MSTIAGFDRGLFSGSRLDIYTSEIIDNGQVIPFGPRALIMHPTTLLKLSVELEPNTRYSQRSAAEGRIRMAERRMETLSWTVLLAFMRRMP